MFTIKDIDTEEYYIGDTEWGSEIEKALTVRSWGYASQLKTTVKNQLEVSGESRNIRIQELEVKEAC